MASNAYSEDNDVVAKQGGASFPAPGGGVGLPVGQSKQGVQPIGLGYY